MKACMLSFLMDRWIDRRQLIYWHSLQMNQIYHKYVFINSGDD